MAITAQEVNKLRQMTGAGMMDCKNALTETDGDFDKAVDSLRKKGQKISEKRADKDATEGAVFVKSSEDEKTGYVIALNCETDFVAKNEEFQKLGAIIVSAAVKNNCADVTALKAVDVDGSTIETRMTDLMGKIGEKLEISSYEKIQGEKVVKYLHAGAKLGVLVALEGINGKDVAEAGKDVAMQIAAMRPIAVDKDDVDPTVVQSEIEIGKEQARNEGKPEAIIEKIALGKLNKFYSDRTLLNQDFVKDSSKTIRQMLDGVNKGLTVKAFKRVGIGA